MIISNLSVKMIKSSNKSLCKLKIRTVKKIIKWLDLYPIYQMILNKNKKKRKYNRMKVCLRKWEESQLKWKTKKFFNAQKSREE